MLAPSGSWIAAKAAPWSSLGRNSVGRYLAENAAAAITAVSIPTVITFLLASQTEPATYF